jgi:L-ribulose-5-phosphate 3-epimerase
MEESMTKGYSLGIYEKAMPDHLTWKERFCAAKDAGYDYLEMSVDESDSRLSRLDYSREERIEILQLSKETCLGVDSICLSAHRRYPLGSQNPETVQRSLMIMEQAIRLAYDLGVRIIQLATYDVYYNEVSTPASRETFLENLYKSTLMASECGVILGLETMENPFANTVAKTMEFIRQIASPYLKIYPDIGNLSNAQEDVETDLLTGSGHIVAAHLKETVPGVFRNMKFGTGRVRFPDLITQLLQMDVVRFTAEFWYRNGQSYEAELSKSYSYLTSLLRSARGGITQ